MGELTRGKLFIQNKDGSYSELGHITEAQIITDEIEPSDNSIDFKPNDYSITMTFDRMSNNAVAAILGWRAKGPMRKRVLRRAFWMMHKVWLAHYAGWTVDYLLKCKRISNSY